MPQDLLININRLPHFKNRRHVRISFRSSLKHLETLLASQELSNKQRKFFAEEAENILMTHGLLDPDWEAGIITQRALLD